MVVLYDKHRRAIERLYVDRATLKRNVESEKPSGETVLEEVVVFEDQPCRLSQKSPAVNGQTEAQNDISYEVKLFIAPEVEIVQGDVLEVARGKLTPEGWEQIAPPREYTAGEPFLYPTHQEVSLQRKGTA